LTNSQNSSIIVSSFKKFGSKIGGFMDIYKRIFKWSMDGIFVMNENRVITLGNNALYEMLGYEENELVGKSASILHTSEGRYEGFGEKIESETEENGSFVIEWTMRRKNGSEFPVEVALTQGMNENGSVDEYVLIVRDISQRKKNEKELRESEGKYRELSESLPLTIFETDRLGNISYVNEKGLKVFGYDREDVLVKGNFRGINILQVISLEESETAIDNVQLVLMGKKIDTEYKCVRKDGTTFPAIVNSTPISSNGKINGIRGILFDITDRKETEEKIRHLALHDALTGLPNRTLLQDRFLMASESSIRSGNILGCFMLDLDNFKRINDSFGHQAGDLLLKEVANRIGHCLRKVDTLARIGGDEFMVLLPEIRKIGEVEKIVTRMLEKMNEPFIINGENIFVTTSIGVSLYPDHGCDLDSLGIKADAAMYAAKEGGKNSFRICSDPKN